MPCQTPLTLDVRLSPSRLSNARSHPGMRRGAGLPAWQCLHGLFQLHTLELDVPCSSGPILYDFWEHPSLSEPLDFVFESVTRLRMQGTVLSGSVMLHVIKRMPQLLEFSYWGRNEMVGGCYEEFQAALRATQQVVIAKSVGSGVHHLGDWTLDLKHRFDAVWRRDTVESKIHSITE